MCDGHKGVWWDGVGWGGVGQGGGGSGNVCGEGGGTVAVLVKEREAVGTLLELFVGGIAHRSG